MARVAETGVRDVFSLIDANDNARLSAYLVGRPEGAGARNLQNMSAVMYALYRRNHNAVKMLRDRLFSVDLWEAAALGEANTVRMLASEASFDIEAFSPDGLTALQLASFFGRLAVVEALLELGANPNAVSKNPQGIRAIHGATVGRHDEIVVCLKAAGADLDARPANGQTALDIAVKNRDQLLIEVLTQH
jgi:ankyrin repeat protein